MAEIKDKLTSLELLKVLHDYNENNYANKNNAVFWKEVDDNEISEAMFLSNDNLVENTELSYIKMKQDIDDINKKINSLSDDVANINNKIIEIENLLNSLVKQ